MCALVLTPTIALIHMRTNFLSYNVMSHEFLKLLFCENLPLASHMFLFILNNLIFLWCHILNSFF
jgi:hypothetical protein